MMKRIILFILILGFPIISTGQNVDQVTHQLNLPKINFKARPSISEKVQNNPYLKDISFSKAQIKHKIFDEVKYVYDRDNALFRISYSFKNRRSVKKNIERIYNLLDEYFGPTKYLLNPDYEGTYNFENKRSRAVLNVNYDKNPNRSFLTISALNPKIEATFDEFQEGTYYRVLYTPSVVETNDGGQLLIEFYGTEKNGHKKINMRIESYGKEWKFIDKLYIATDDGEVWSTDFDAKREVNEFASTTEIAVVPLPENVLSKINNVNDAKFRVEGKENYEFRLTPFIVAALNKLEGEFYQ